MMKRTVVAAVAAGALWAAPAEAQERRQTIEIRGQVPTPQVVTVRPREVPRFDAQVLVPAFYEASFWGVILPGYAIVPRSDVFGRAQTDSMPVIETRQAAPVAGVPQIIRRPGDPAAQPAGVDTAAAPVRQQAAPAATRNEEIEVLRRELESRRARMDSIDAARKRQLDSLEQAVRERQRRALPDSTVRPPGTSPAPSR